MNINRPTRQELIANDAIWAAFYRDGKNLGQICGEFNCGIYDLSPWLTAPLINATTEPKDRNPDNA